MKSVCAQGLLLFIFFFSARPCVAQLRGDAKYVISAIDRAYATAKYMSENSSYGFDNNVCLLAGFLNESATVKWTTSLQYGESYLLTGGGDEDAQDVDITVTDAQGNVVVKDQQTDNKPIVSWTARSYGNYTFELKLYRCAESGSYCAMTIMRKYANSLPFDNMSTALANSYRMWNTMRTKYDMGFHSKSGQWCLFGMILSKGGSQTTTNIDLGTADHYFISTADNNARDIDICITDNNQNTLRCDTDPDPNPVVKYYTDNRYYYGLKTTNHDSYGKSFIVTSMFTER